MLSKIPPKSEWYRLPEREHTRTKSGKKAGDYIAFERVIVRAGYQFQPFDMPQLEEDAEVLRICANYAGVTVGQAYNVLQCLEFGTTSPMKASGYDNTLQSLREGISEELDRRTGMYGLRRAIRAEWLKRQQNSTEPRIRTFWYVNVDGGDYYQVKRVVTKQCGEYHSGHTYGYDDYDPPYLHAWVYQPLYEIETGWWWKFGKPVMCYVHPLDVIEK